MFNKLFNKYARFLAIRTCCYRLPDLILDPDGGVKDRYVIATAGMATCLAEEN